VGASNQPSQVHTGGKAPRVLHKKSKRQSIYVVVALISIAVVALIVFALIKANSPSNKLTTEVINLQKTAPCSDGLKQIKPLGSQLETKSNYSIASREAGLNYLVTCSFSNGDKAAALNYASKLKKLYTSSGDTQKLQQLQSFINYMNSYGQLR
jgi:hypothetical protein